MHEFLGAVRHGLANILNFSGRESRGRFWLYIGAVFLVFLVGSQIAGLVLFPTQFEIRQASHNAEEITAVIYSFSKFVLAATAVFVALVASAVCRRLHDIEWSGLMGLAPLPFLFAGFYILMRLMPDWLGEDPNIQLFFIGFANNVVYLILLLLLVVLLAREGDPGPNRYGDAPLES